MNKLFVAVAGLSLIAGAFGEQVCFDQPYGANNSIQPSITATVPDSDLTRTSYGTIIDSDTQLEWQICSAGQTLNGQQCSGVPAELSWSQALSDAQASTQGGFIDWRLPNLKELMSIVEQACRLPSANVDYFAGIVPDIYWSSTPTDHRVDAAWGVVFATAQTQAWARHSDWTSNDTGDGLAHAIFVRTQQ